MKTYYCKSCGSGQYWKQCPKCGKVICANCGVFGKGEWPKMQASNKCPFCNGISTFGLTRLTGQEDILAKHAR